MKFTKYILHIYALEVALLLGMGIFATIELGCIRATENAVMLKNMALLSLRLSVIVIIESVVLSAVIKRKNICISNINRYYTRLVRFLLICVFAFGLLWIVYGHLHEHIAVKILGYSHGSDAYMEFGKSGDRIIILGLFSSCVIEGTLIKMLRR